MSIFARPEETGSTDADRSRKEQAPVRPRAVPDSSGEVSIIASGVRIEGDVHVDGDMRVGGRINGKVHAKDRLVVATGGIVNGGIETGEGDIAGTVEGDVNVRGRLVIRETASVVGQIEAENLVVEDGAAIVGTCKVGKPTRLSKTRDQAGDGAPEGAPTLLME